MHRKNQVFAKFLLPEFQVLLKITPYANASPRPPSAVPAPSREWSVGRTSRERSDGGPAFQRLLSFSARGGLRRASVGSRPALGGVFRAGRLGPSFGGAPNAMSRPSADRRVDQRRSVSRFGATMAGRNGLFWWPDQGNIIREESIRRDTDERDVWSDPVSGSFDERRSCTGSLAGSKEASGSAAAAARCARIPGRA